MGDELAVVAGALAGANADGRDELGACATVPVADPVGLAAAAGAGPCCAEAVGWGAGGVAATVVESLVIGV